MLFLIRRITREESELKSEVVIEVTNYDMQATRAFPVYEFPVNVYSEVQFAGSSIKDQTLHTG